MTLLCRISLPCYQAEVTLDVPPGTDRAGLLALLSEHIHGAEVFVFMNGRILLSGQVVLESGEALILPAISGG